MANFSKRHYIAIAEVLRKPYATTKGAYEAAFDADAHIATEAAYTAVVNLVNDLIIVFGQDNPRFKRGHFLNVVEGEKALNSRP